MTQTKNNITESNKLIAEFMGWSKWNKDDADDRFINEMSNTLQPADVSPKYMGFLSSWEWLMPVVEKIETIDVAEVLSKGNGQGYGNQVRIHTNSCEIEPTNWDAPLIPQTLGKDKIEATYKTVVKFIKWYNQNQK